MGIHGLHPLIRPACVDCRISDQAFKGTTAGIDVSIWLYRAFMSTSSQDANQAMVYIMKMLDLLIENQIKPVVVFDGRPVPAKAVTIAKRRQLRDKQIQKALLLINEGQIQQSQQKIKDGEKLLRCTRDVHSSNQELIQALQTRKIDYIISPFEADAQLTWLAKNSVIDFIITEDSDLVVYGCQQILFKLDMKGNGVFYNRDELPSVFENEDEEFDFEDFRKQCILSGCDYLPSIYGIGLAKARKLMQQTRGMTTLQMTKKIAAILKLRKADFDTKVYAHGYEMAANTFLHQVVFDVNNKMFVHLTEPPVDNTDDISYTGNVLPGVNAVDFAVGNINLNSLIKKENFNPITSGYPLDSIWYRKFTETASSKVIKPGAQYFIHLTVKDDKLLDCQDCGHIFQKLEDIKEHWNMYGGGKLYVCDPCGIQFDTNLELNSHRLFQHNLDQDLNNCTDTEDLSCDLNIIALVPGQTLPNQNVDSYSCPEINCCQQFNNKFDLVRHSLTHSADASLLCLANKCTASFSTVDELAEHMGCHGDQKPYVCDYGKCYEAFANIAQLNIHKKAHKDSRRFTCHQSGCGQIFQTKFKLLCHSLKQAHKSFICHSKACNKSFKTKSASQLHSRQCHSNIKPHPCTVKGCPWKFKRRCNLKTHENFVHSVERPYPCTVKGCPWKFKRRWDLKIHENLVHSGERPYPCMTKGCPRKFKTKDNLKRHENEVHSEVTLYPCKVEGCPSQFKTKDNLKRHENEVHSEVTLYPCKVEGCPSQFKTKDNLKRHEKQVHSEERPYICKFEGCPRKYKTRCDLKSHENLVHSNETRYPCTTKGCPRKFKAKSDLKTHKKLVHSKERPYPCKVEGCPRKFKAKSNLKTHEKQVHSEERPYPCKVEGCPSKFKCKKNLKRHENLVHSNETPYPCTVKGCPRKFKTKWNLKKHEKRKHSEEMPYPCKVEGCPSQFETETKLKRHENLVHSNETPYPCTVKGCPWKFKTRWHLKRHEKRKHSEERPYPCKVEECPSQFKTEAKLKRHAKEVHGTTKP